MASTEIVCVEETEEVAEKVRADVCVPQALPVRMALTQLERLTVTVKKAVPVEVTVSLAETEEQGEEETLARWLRERALLAEPV